jgi:hypothetical protein
MGSEVEMARGSVGAWRPVCVWMWRGERSGRNGGGGGATRVGVRGTAEMGEGGWSPWCGPRVRACVWPTHRLLGKVAPKKLSPTLNIWVSHWRRVWAVRASFVRETLHTQQSHRLRPLHKHLGRPQEALFNTTQRAGDRVIKVWLFKSSQPSSHA